MEQLIFIGIIVLFSILEAVARKGRAKQGEGEGIPPPEEPQPRVPRPQRRAPHPRAPQPSGSLPYSYDEDPSFDEAATAEEGRIRPEPPAERAPPIGEEAVPRRSGSEGLIPAEVWDEIQRMARGEAPQGREGTTSSPFPPPPAPVPAPSAPPERRPPMSRPPGWAKPAPPRPRPAGKAKPSERAGAPTAQRRSGKGLGRAPARAVEAPPQQEGTADHPVHLAHEAFGTAPSARAGVSPEGPAPRGPSGAEALRRLLASDRGTLRQAVILQEVLGPPPGLRD